MIQQVEGREREYDDYVDPYQPPVASPAPVAPVAPPVPPPSNQPPPNTPPPYGPGVYMDPNSPPPFAAPSGLTWKFDPANGWYPGSSFNYGGENDPGPGDGGPVDAGAFDYGRPLGNQFTPYQSMEPFQYSGGPLVIEPFGETFAPSSWEDAEKEPGFAESQARLAKMIQNTAAYRGILRSGATIGDLGTYLDQNKGQNFQQFDARNFRNFNSRRETWAANAGVKADAWSRNVGNEQFAYGQAATDNDRKNNYTFNTENANFNDLLSRWTTLVNSATSLARPV